MDHFNADILIIGAGGARPKSCNAIAAAEADPGPTVALVSKVYPMENFFDVVHDMHEGKLARGVITF